MNVPNWTLGNQVALLQGGAAYFAALIEAVDAAQHSVWLETYIFDFDPEHGVASIAVARALVRAAQRGVKVRLLMDGVGTGEVPESWQSEFNAAGVQWRIYSPFGWAGYFQPSRWRRLHRKLSVVDAHTSQVHGFCGGINVLDDYFDPNHGSLEQPRFDFAVRLAGPVVEHSAVALEALWNRTQQWSDAKQAARQAEVRPMLRALGRSGRRVVQGLRRAARGGSGARAESSMGSGIKAALLLRDNLTHRKRIERAYRSAIGAAKDEIWISNAYFLPGGKLLRGLLAAAKRGVTVTLLLQGKREYFFQVHATRAIYATLLQAGIRIVEYKASFLHAKVAVVDANNPHGAWATVGSSNLDPFSLLMAREANVVVQDSAFAQDLRDRLEHAALSEGVPVKADDFLSRPWHERWVDHMAHAVMRCTLWLLGKRY
jgi:cardiolipin synthase A/B